MKKIFIITLATFFLLAVIFFISTKGVKKESKSNSSLPCETNGKKYNFDEAVKNPGKVCFLEITKKEELNGLTNLIPSLSSVEQLNVIGVSGTAVPRSIGNLKTLKVLFFDEFHGIPNLPDSLGDLGNLNYLRITDTDIKRLPENISHLKILRAWIF